MGRKRNEALNAATAEAIKTAARQLMAEEGTNGLSVRGIAKVLNITAPAIYHYFSSLDELTTALIVDGFNALADALEAAADGSKAQTAGGKLVEVLTAYRAWAIEHPTDFQLIYGNPIPGYVAPRDVTVPAVVRTFVVPIRFVEDAMQTGEWQPQEPYDRIPREVEVQIRTLIAEGGYPIRTLSFYLAMILWTQLQGIIYLELFNHLQANVGDVKVFYKAQIHNSLRAMGLRLPP